MDSVEALEWRLLMSTGMTRDMSGASLLAFTDCDRALRACDRAWSQPVVHRQTMCHWWCAAHVLWRCSVSDTMTGGQIGGLTVMVLVGL